MSQSPALARNTPRVVRNRLGLALTLVGAWLSSGCLADSDVGSSSADAKAVTRVLLCQQGMADRTTESDKGLFELCESVEEAGFTLIRDGAFPAFGALDENGAYAALFDALDTNGDRKVDEDDELVAVHLMGFSWGGINVTDIAARLKRDTRILTKRRGVSAMVLLDPFQPLVSRSVVPSNVFYTWVYRQTETTQGDCSIGPSLGFGFNGHRPLAKSDSRFCETYDLDSFMEDVGHCDVPRAAREAAFLNLTERQSLAAWDDHGDACDLD